MVEERPRTNGRAKAITDLKGIEMGMKADAYQAVKGDLRGSLEMNRELAGWSERECVTHMVRYLPRALTATASRLTTTERLFAFLDQQFLPLTTDREEDSWDALLNRLRLSGDLNEALHEMLLAAIGFCQKELSIHIPRANTPREIQDALPTDFAALEAFETLVQGAELAWFGAKPVDRPMFQSGLDALERILRLK